MLDDILKKESSDKIHKLLTIEDRNEGKHFLYWSALKHKRRLCEKLLRYIESCKTLENKEVLLSVVLVGACTIQKNVSIVRELIKFGADVNFCNACRLENIMRNDEIGIEKSIDEQHMCPLDVAMSYGNISHVENLLNRGATISHCSWRQWEIIHKAFALDDMYVKQPVFLEAFLDVFSKYNANKQNESSSVEKSGLYVLFNEINDSCDDLNDIFLTFAKYSVLSTTLLNAFLECKVDANVTNRDKKNALHLLVDHSGRDISEKCKVIELLLLNGCDANMKGKQRHTPLSVAIRKQYKNPQILQSLLKGNSDVNIKVGEGKSLLHVCIETKMPPNDAINIIKLLKDQKCDPFLVDKKGHSVIEILFQQEEINIEILSELCYYPLHTCLKYSKITEERKIEIIRYLHDRGMDIDCCDETKQTPLSTAITSCCSQSVIQCFLQLGASLNRKFQNDHSILQLFLRFHPDIDDLTIKEFAKQDIHLQSGNFMVIIADIFKSSKNYHFLLEIILDQFSSESASFKSFLDEENRTFLHLTVMSVLTDRECKEVSEMFINNGVDVNQREKSQRYALDLAIRNEKVRRTSTILLLLEHSKLKEFNTKTFLLDIFHSGQICIEILSSAIDKKIINKSKAPKTKILHILAEKGLDNFYKNFPITGHTSCPISTESNLGLPHSQSVSYKMIDMVERNETSNESQFIKCLLECGLQVNEKDDFGRTPLHKACYCKDQDISLIAALCENGADTNAKDQDKNTPLHSCVASESEDLIVLAVCEILLRYSAKLGKCNNKKRTPLLLAVKQEKERINTVALLLREKSDINVKDSKDESCLHYCISKRIPDSDACKLLQVLLESNPKLEHKNTLGLTPLNLASTCNTFSRVLCIIRLLEKGAKVNSIDSYNRTPLFNVVRCLRGHDILLSLERIVRLAILFACRANPGYATKSNETVKDFETGDSVVKSMIREYPASEDKLVSFVYTKLQAVSKYYSGHSKNHSFKFDLKELKKEISGAITEAIGYLGEICFDIEEDDVCLSSDCVTSAQVAMEIDE
ncbi:serine/threonine-protein phosphatase 6 regulatory ankyrin repeat subunit B-like [Mytilus californianus]|uniref:serine/threonine-protein phosphatase 6 regulatory ankyrin repeat subunit B-like n=1 Tax=Mytilus californianus TaxID=6549 RepID=UPI002247158C|nr:serine/threonine-protein phosphatase 6 regulatory ankyrin repeat subunit B-like [Mytilus californianus]